MIQGRGRVYQGKFYTGRRASHDAVSYCTLGSHVVCLSCAVSANACSDAQACLSHVGDVAEDGQVVGVEEQSVAEDGQVVGVEEQTDCSSTPTTWPSSATSPT